MRKLLGFWGIAEGTGKGVMVYSTPPRLSLRQEECHHFFSYFFALYLHDGKELFIMVIIINL